jgi:hypothetical protein
MNFSFNASNQLQVVNYSYFPLISTPVYRDASAWYHIVWSLDTTQATASNRMKLYVNGAEVTTFGTDNRSSLTQNSDQAINQAAVHYIGGQTYLNAYLADIHFIDGQALTPSSFGEFDTNGVWQPIEYTGSYNVGVGAVNGFYLPFSDNSTAAALGTDTSGNGNTWTVNNLSVTAGSGNDSLVDTPTGYGTDTGAGGEVRGNYATLNPLGTAGATPANGNLSVSSSSTVGNRISTFFLTNGKWYWEGSGNGYVATVVGRGGEGFTGSVSVSGSKAIGWYPVDGVAYWDGGSSGSGTTYSDTDVIGVALDMDAGTVKFYKNNTLIHNLTFGSGTVPDLSTGVFPGYNVGAGPTSVDLNFGQRQWAYAAPAGFKALCTTNLPEPTIADGSTAMDVKLYTGNGSTQTISGLNFSPDLVWIKERSGTRFHALCDSVRGDGILLYSNSTLGEQDIGSTVVDLTSDGFNLGFNGGFTAVSHNWNAVTHAAWTWDAGSSTVTNTAGSITSQVRTNGYLSIVTYTGTGSTATVGHGLGVAPSMIIVKSRTVGGTGWPVYHSSLGGVNSVIVLSSTGATQTVSNYWGSAAPTSTVFGIGNSAFDNNNGNLVAYCFAPVAGYSSFGSYTGNGSADGPFVYTGFRPRWVMIKASSSVSYGNWVLHDTSRSASNVSDKNLYPNLSNAEDGTYLIDCLSNGFKLRSGSFDGTNGSGATYIYAAFAESPFQYARAR